VAVDAGHANADGALYSIVAWKGKHWSALEASPDAIQEHVLGQVQFGRYSKHLLNGCRADTDDVTIRSERLQWLQQQKQIQRGSEIDTGSDSLA
jgi:hypothetical protein